MKSALITGSTGFVGKNLLESLVGNTELEELFLLVRNVEKAKVTLSEIIRVAGEMGKRINFLEGNIIYENMGLSEENIQIIKDVNEIYHLAANISLSIKDKEDILKVNLDGTMNLFNMVKDFKNIKNIFYFSTGYVCGKERQIVKEEWIINEGRFRNPYEESKYLAERFIKEFIDKQDIPITIIRPTLIGTRDNSKYEELKYQTIYYYATILKEAISIQDNYENVRLVGRSDVTLNLITIEELIEILLEIRKLDQKSQIYNLASSSNFSVLSYLEGIKEAIGFESNFNFIGDIHFDNPTLAEALINKKTKSYFEYNLNSYLDWDVSNTRDIREKLDIVDREDGWIKGHIKDFLLHNKNEFTKKI